MRIGESFEKIDAVAPTTLANITNNISSVTVESTDEKLQNIVTETKVVQDESFIPENTRIYPIKEFASKNLDPQHGQYILVKIMFSLYIETCNKSGLLSEHATQKGFTKYIEYLYPTERRKNIW